MPLFDPVSLTVMGGLAFLNYLSNRSATNSAADKQYEALEKAQGAITQGKDKALELFAPYLKNAGKDYEQQRGLVQSGFYQQPYGKTFQSQQYNPGGGFSYNAKTGQSSVTPWQPQGGPASFQAQALPSFPQPPPMPQGATTAGPMQRPNAMPVPLEQVMQAGMQGVMQQMPGAGRMEGQPMNQMEQIINRGKWQKPSLNDFRNQGLSMQDLYDRGLVNPYGSGDFIPKTYGRV